MIKGVCTIVGCSLAILALVIFFPGVGSAAETKPALASDQLLSVGKIGPKAVDIRVKIEKPKGDATAEQSPVLKLTTSQNVYLTAVYIAPNGDATILVPSREGPDNLFVGGKEYLLFGSESKVKLVAGDKQKRSRIVFYASSNPMKFDALNIPEGQDFLTIDHSSVKDIELLCSTISSISNDECFSRKVVVLKEESGKEEAFGLMGLPTGVQSASPQSVTGVQGLKTNILESPKE